MAPSGLENSRALWQRMSLVQKAMLLVVGVGIAGACVLVANWARRPQMALLFGHLPVEEAARVVEKLRERGTAYELGVGGTAVYVPTDNVPALRLEMASAGLPDADPSGYRLLDEERIGASPFTQQVNYIRAIEGELAKSLQMLEGVVSARVHVVKPEKSVFAGRSKESSATVVLRLKPGWRLSPANVSAVMHLVSGSCEGLTPDKVVVVDSAGTLLSGDHSEEFSASADTFLDYKTRVEQYLGRKAEEMLAAVLGPRQVSVRVTAEIGTINSTQTVETYDPTKRVITKEEIRSSSGSESGGKEENITSEYLVSRTVEQRQDTPGSIKSLSVAAFVNLSRPVAADGTDADATKTADASKPVVSESDVEEIIRNAIGLKETDTLKVVNTSFYEPPVTEDPAEQAGFMTTEFALSMGRQVSLAVLVIGALIALRMVRRSWKKSEVVEVSTAGQPALTTASQQAQPQMLPANAGDFEALRQQITHALQEKPDEVKRLFLSWAQSEHEVES